MKKQVKQASFTDNVGTVTFYDGTTQEMTYDEYRIMERNFSYSSIAQLVRHIQKKGAFYDAGHDRALQWVYTDQAFHFFHGKDLLIRSEFEKVMKLLKRYQRFYWYVKETLPQWKKVELEYYADNSVYEIQVNKCGETRKVMITGPHGDVCY